MHARPQSQEIARSYIGSTQWGYGHNTFCESFAEFCTGSGWQGSSAYDAWQRNSHLALAQAAPGACVYFAPSTDNENFGHVGIVDDDTSYFISVTFNGVQRYETSWWRNNSAPLLGYISY